MFKEEDYFINRYMLDEFPDELIQRIKSMKEKGEEIEGETEISEIPKDDFKVMVRYFNRENPDEIKEFQTDSFEIKTFVSNYKKDEPFMLPPSRESMTKTVKAEYNLKNYLVADARFIISVNTKELESATGCNGDEIGLNGFNIYERDRIISQSEIVPEFFVFDKTLYTIIKVIETDGEKIKSLIPRKTKSKLEEAFAFCKGENV